jgi:hypothetical protein
VDKNQYDVFLETLRHLDKGVVYGDYHHDRGVAVISGRRRSAANADMGWDDRHGIFRHQYRSTHYLPAGVGFVSNRVVAQLDW